LLVDFAAACRLDYATSLVAESACASVCPPSAGGECALGTDGDPDALDIPTPRSYAEVIEGPYSSQWQAAMDVEMASWKSTSTYVDKVPPPGANIVSGMWIFRVKRPPGSPPAFKARYVARGFSQRQGVDFFQTFSPTPKMTTLRVLLYIVAQHDYELHSLDFSTAFLQGSLHEEIWLRRPPGFTGSFPAGTQWSLRRPVYGLRQAPREWHDTLRTTLAALGFAPSTVDPSLFLRTDTTLPPFYVLVYVDDLIFATDDTEALTHVKSGLQKRHTCTDLGELTCYLGLRITRDRAQRTITLTQSHMVQQVLQRFGFTYSSPQSTPLPILSRWTQEGRIKASRRRDTKNLLKQGNKVRSWPHSAARVNSSRSSSSSATSAKAFSSSAAKSSSSSSSANSSAANSSSSSSSAASARASSSSRSRLRRVSSSSAPNTTSPGSSSTPGTSTSKTSSRSTSSNTSSSRNYSTFSSSGSSTSSSGSSTPKACAPYKPLTQLLRRQSRRSTDRTSRQSSTLRLSTPRLNTLRLSTPSLSTPSLSTPRLSTPRLSTPRCSTSSST
ncbi:unnamed protein product, partial [Closterium sp. NIES-53]